MAVLVDVMCGLPVVIEFVLRYQIDNEKQSSEIDLVEGKQCKEIRKETRNNSDVCCVSLRG